MARPKQDGLLYFPLDTDFFLFADKRIKRLFFRYKHKGLVLYLYLCAESYRTNGYYLRWDVESMEDAMDDLHLTEGFIKQVMAFLFSQSLLVKRILTVPETAITAQNERDDRPQCELADSGNGQKRAEVITSSGIQKRYQEAVKSRKRDVYVDAKIWLLNENDTATHIKVTHNINKSCGNESKSCGNESKSCGNDTNKIKESKEENKNNLCKADANALFERLWKLYPEKKGKGRISDTQKMKLLKIGFDEMSRAIKRYLAELKKDSWRNPQNGSTFFNSGYVDYLDANYVPGDQADKGNSGKNQFTNFQQNNYNFGQLEEELRSN